MARSILATDLFNEAEEIRKTGIAPVFFRIEATIHVNGNDIPAMSVDYVDTLRNYLKDRFEVITLGLKLGKGTYETLVVPYQTNIEITLRYIPLMDKGVTEDKGQGIKSQRYKAKLINGSSSTLEGNSLGSNNPVALDKVAMATPEFQILDPVVEKLRLFTFGSILRSTSIPDAVRGVLSLVSENASKDARAGFRGVDISSTVNTAIRKHIVIPPNTPFVNVLNVIHDKADGIFNSGLAWFYQKGIWYVFPPYNHQRFSKETRTLTVVNLPANKYPNPEKSYRTIGKSVIILSTGEVKHQDRSEEMLLNLGNGIKFADANTFFTSRVKVEGNKATFDKSKNVSSFAFEQREDGKNLIRESEARITGNMNAEYSKLAARNGGLLQCTWENANIDLLTPGMPVKVLYMEMDAPKEILGTLIGVDCQNAPVTPGGGEKSYRPTAALTFFVERKRGL